MIITLIDDEPLALALLTDAVHKAVPEALTHGFLEPEGLLRFVREHPCDVAFLDIEMREMNGILLAKRLKTAQPDINIIFVTGYSDYSLDAFRLHASGYVLKPATPQKVLNELENLRTPVPEAPRARICVQTFGNFEVFADGQPLQFYYTKTKELLAYLIDRRGAALSTNELCAVLWEDKPNTGSSKSGLRHLISDLRATLRSVAAEDILRTARNAYSIVPERLDCDFYRLLEGDAAAISAYRGEYMSQYSWAELTLGRLEGGSAQNVER